MKVVGFTGGDGGRLARTADAAFIVPSGEYGPVEDSHLILDHIIAGYLREKLRTAAGEIAPCVRRDGGLAGR
jgi:D-sedoheptulose 7-phosphate isomerase